MDLDQDFKEFILLLNNHEVEYLVVGGYAVTVHGFPRYTGDIDFWINPTMENAQKLERAIIDFGFGSLDISQQDFLRKDYVLQLGYPPNRIDIMTGVTGLSFEECWQQKQVIELQEIKINFISLHHLKINKKASGRDKDNLDLRNLP